MAVRLGTHVQLSDLISETEARGAELAQVMLSDPQSWKKPVSDHPGGFAALGESAKAAGIGVYVHAPYLINVASTNNRVRIPSRKLLQQTIDAATELGAAGVVVHGGHLRDGDDPATGPQNWFKAVDGLELSCPLLIENTAGGQFAQARFLPAIAALWEAISTSKNIGQVGFCLDTCHAHAAGLDLATVVADIKAITGRIDLVHLNDSRDAAGSGADRHANLGEGEIEGGLLVDVVRQADTDVILETPGDSAEHLADLAWLRHRL